MITCLYNIHYVGIFFKEFIFAVVSGLVKDNYYKTRLYFLQAYASMWH